MSEAKETATKHEAGVELQGLFAFKVGMASVYDETGTYVPVTVLKYEPTTVSQVKTPDQDGYSAVQVAFCPSRATRVNQPEKGQLKKAGFENGALFVREILQATEGVEVGQKVSIATLKKGDTVKLTSRSKGRGFTGAVKRWNLAGGPAAHGSHFHRRPGSVGNRTWPGRVMPGKKFPGHFGDEIVTVKNVLVVDVIPEENVVLVKGPVPGAPRSLVQLMKVN
jgi:large subunit ribosomal protein L3